MTYNSIPITRVAHSLTDAMGVQPPRDAEEPIPMIETLVKTFCVSGKAEKMLIFCPDAIGQWLIQKYTMDFAPVMRHTQLQIPLCAAFPPVTPVNFASIFTGTQPSVHGIRKYEKKLLNPQEVDTIFDAFVRAGKKVALVAIENSSMGTIFRYRDGIDYFIEDEIEFTNDPDGATTVRRGLELLDKTDENGEPYYDVVLVYSMKYDDNIHETWPESAKSLHAMKCHNQQFEQLAEKTAEVWAKYDTFLAYITDHGIHADHHSNDGILKDKDGRGNHYADIPEDMNVSHFFGIQPARKTE